MALGVRLPTRFDGAGLRIVVLGVRLPIKFDGFGRSDAQNSILVLVRETTVVTITRILARRIASFAPFLSLLEKSLWFSISSTIQALGIEHSGWPWQRGGLLFGVLFLMWFNVMW